MNICKRQSPLCTGRHWNMGCCHIRSHQLQTNEICFPSYYFITCIHTSQSCSKVRWPAGKAKFIVCGEHPYLLNSQRSPKVPVWHVHVKLLTPSEHVPALRQGLLPHSSMSFMKMRRVICYIYNTYHITSGHHTISHICSLTLFTEGTSKSRLTRTREGQTAVQGCAVTTILTWVTVTRLKCCIQKVSMCRSQTKMVFCA